MKKSSPNQCKLKLTAVLASVFQFNSVPHPVNSCRASRLEIIIEILHQSTIYVDRFLVYIPVSLVHEEQILLCDLPPATTP